MTETVVVGCLEETADTLEHLYYLGGAIDAIITLPESKAQRAGITN
jgi:hypothetical protein